MDLLKDGAVVASSTDDGNGKDDNLSLALLYKAKMNYDASF